MSYICPDNMAEACGGWWPNTGDDIACVHPDRIPAYFASIRDRTEPLVLVTTGSDRQVNDEVAGLMPDCIEHWFAVNKNTDNPRVTALPLGVANPCYQHGDFRYIEWRRLRPRTTVRRVLVRHCIATNRGERQRCLDVFKGHRIATVDCYETVKDRPCFKDFIKSLHNHDFCVCPEGNGMDTHRVWECLYLGVIPICKPTPCIVELAGHGLPIAFVDEWEQVSSQWLDEQEAALSPLWDTCDHVLGTSYWMRMIGGHVGTDLQCA